MRCIGRDVLECDRISQSKYWTNQSESECGGQPGWQEGRYKWIEAGNRCEKKRKSSWRMTVGSSVIIVLQPEHAGVPGGNEPVHCEQTDKLRLTEQLETINKGNEKDKKRCTNSRIKATK